MTDLSQQPIDGVMPSPPQCENSKMPPPARLHATTRADGTEHQPTRDIFLLMVVLNLAAIPGTSRDLPKFVLPWYHHLIAHGRFHALAGNFSNYSPPYLYLLSLGSLADQWLGPFLIVKLISILGNILLGLCGYRLLTAFIPPRQAILPSLAVPVLPTVLINGPWWGQCDALYAAPVILGVAELVRGRQATGLAALGLAFSVKLQAIFIAPLCLALLLKRRIALPYLAIPILVYGMMMLPAWLAGRPAYDLATIYLSQADYYHDLSRSAPNLWEYVHGLNLMRYETGLPIGLGLGLLTFAALVSLGLSRLKLNRENILLLATASAVALPYVLPAMHERYFFLGEIFSYLLAIVLPSPRLMRIAILLQIGSSLACMQYLLRIPASAAAGAIFVTWAVVLLLRQIRETSKSGQLATD